ncbi:MAG: hypothetical protein Aurels2KO_19820 [Aureliella sp.]
MNHWLRYLTFVLLALATHATATAQALSELPRTEYYLARELYGAGAQLSALEGFTVAYDRGREVGNARWVDSIPPLVMAGECLYQQGKIAQALEQYDAALNLLVQHPNWIEQLDLVIEEIPTFQFGKGVNWFSQPTSNSILAVPEAVQLAVDPLQARVAAPGVVVAPVSLVTRLDAAEVFYTLSIALSRRNELLGPLTEYSPMANSLRGVLGPRRSHPVPWVTTSWKVLRGIMLLGEQKTVAEGVGELRGGVSIGGTYHYLSSLALTELARVDHNNGNFPAAMQSLQTASLLAAQFEQHVTLSEVTHQLAMTAAAGRRAEMVEPLNALATWAAKRSTITRATALGGIARILANNNDVARGSKAAAQARNALISREVVLPRHQAQLAYTSAMLAYSSSRPASALPSLGEALSAMQGSADSGAVVPEIFQAQLTLDLLAKGSIPKQTALELLRQLMQEPSIADWRLKPLETLARITTSSMPAYERLLDLSYEAGIRDEQMLFLIDRLQRQRLYEALPLGGRLFSWRNALAADPKSLNQLNRQSVTEMKQARPHLQTAQTEMEDLKALLRAQPVPLDERKLASNVKKQYSTLAGLATRHESQLSAVSLAHQPLRRFLPLEVSVDVLREQLGERDCLVAMAVTGRQILGVAMSRDEVRTWSVPGSDNLLAQVASLLNKSGVRRVQGVPLPSEVTRPAADWHANAEALAGVLFPPEVYALISQSKRLILAPHGPLWYVPFELLPAELVAGASPMVADRSVCYIPTGLSVQHAMRPRPQAPRTLGIVGSFFAADADENRVAADTLQAAIPQSELLLLDQKIQSASAPWLRLTADRIWVANPIRSAGLDTVLLPLGGARQSTLGSWLESPRIGARQIIAPGMNTAAINDSLGNGDDIFLPVSAMSISGSTGLVSRWSAGGQSSAAMMLRYMEELGRQRSSEALRVAVVAQWAEQFLVDDEPSLLPAGKERLSLTSGSHPALWAGYMAIGDQTQNP